MIQILVGVFFLLVMLLLVGHLLKPTVATYPMSPAEEAQYDLMHVEPNGDRLIVQLKETPKHVKSRYVDSRTEKAIA